MGLRRRLALWLHHVRGHHVLNIVWSDGQPDGWCNTCDPSYWDRNANGRTFRFTHAHRPAHSEWSADEEAERAMRRAS